MDSTASRPVRLLPYAATVALILWAWQRLDFFDSRRNVLLADGYMVSKPNALASVDHPFHAARFGELLESLSEGHAPRWVAEHQGGYPTEFYPFGGAVLDLLVWLVTFGQMSIPMVHTWSVAITFAMPAVGFLWLCRLADLSPWAGVVAIAAHLSLRGWWWSGGSHELVEWGLVTNVLAAYLIFLALPGLLQIERENIWRWVPMPSLLIAWGIWTNPRSLVAVGATIVAIIAVRAIERRSIRFVQGPALAILTALLLAAPLLVSLVRFNDLYYFVHFQGYGGVEDWLDSSIQAVSTPVFVVALLGLVVVFRPGSTAAELATGFSFLAYSAITLYLVAVDWPVSLAEQLETTRLMPFQRLLMIALAGFAVGRALEWFAPKVLGIGGLAVAGLIVTLYVVAPPSWIPESDRGLVRQGTMATPGIVDLRTSVEIADDAATAGSALLILGHTDFWHDHLWSTLWSDRRFFYDDWLWYWQQEHVGRYDPTIEHSYPLDSSAIDEEYLRLHGIGAVIVTGQAEQVAAEAQFLTSIREGIYDVYLVNDASSLASLGGLPVPVTEHADRIVVTGIDDGGVLTIRQNWFPRWHAQADGEPLEIIHRPDGYMELDVPAGATEVVLTYAVDAVDWLARAGALIGVLLMIASVVRARPTARSELR